MPLKQIFCPNDYQVQLPQYLHPKAQTAFDRKLGCTDAPLRDCDSLRCTSRSEGPKTFGKVNMFANSDNRADRLLLEKICGA
jgi:hypothetical protein